MAQLAGNAHWAEPSPLFAHRARPTPLKCKNEYPVLALVEETVVQTVVGSIVWAFRRLKKPRYREMSARGYALYSVCPQPFFCFLEARCVSLFGIQTWGVHLSTPWLFELAKHPDDRADYCLDYSFLP